MFSLSFSRAGKISIKISKNSSPEGPALISPQRSEVYLEMSNGMMEWWNNGILGFKNGPPAADKSLFYSLYQKKISSF
jgi:hypothetical protein